MVNHHALVTFLRRPLATQMRNNGHQMSRSELDFTIMAQLNALRTHVNDVPSNTVENWFRPTTKYLYMDCLSAKRCSAFYTRLIKIAWWTCTVSLTTMVWIKECMETSNAHHRMLFLMLMLNFWQNLSRTWVIYTHGLPLPGCLPSHDQKVLLLPSDMNKQVVYQQYKSACRESGTTPVQKSKF